LNIVTLSLPVAFRHQLKLIDNNGEFAASLSILVFPSVKGQTPLYKQRVTFADVLIDNFSLPAGREGLALSPGFQVNKARFLLLFSGAVSPISVCRHPKVAVF
jgi:hypothetical protein